MTARILSIAVIYKAGSGDRFHPLLAAVPLSFISRSRALFTPAAMDPKQKLTAHVSDLKGDILPLIRLLLGYRVNYNILPPTLLCHRIYGNMYLHVSLNGKATVA